LLIVSDPFEAYLKLVNHFRPFTPSSKNISDSASMGKNTVIMPNSFIGNHVTMAMIVLFIRMFAFGSLRDRQ
jgi:UDP-3-O-[3-hydroxymyristoyl] glucosamine N-acyltransferase